MTACDWPQLVTWGGVIVGWFVVHKATLKRERRKEKREIAAKVCTNLASLQVSAIDFHTGSHCELRKSTDIAQHVAEILDSLQRAPMIELDISLVHRVALRQAITKQNIDPSDFSSQTPDSVIVLEIRDAVLEMIAAIDEARERVWN